MNGWIIFITCFIAFIAIGFLIDRLIVTYYTWSERKREEVKRIDEIVALVKWEKEKNGN